MDRVEGVVAQRELVQKVITELTLKKEHVFYEFTLRFDVLRLHLIFNVNC